MCVTLWFQEEDYEWGGPGTEMHVSSLLETLAKLARAARRWRIQLSERRMVSCSLVCFYLCILRFSSLCRLFLQISVTIAVQMALTAIWQN